MANLVVEERVSLKSFEGGWPVLSIVEMADEEELEVVDEPELVSLMRVVSGTEWFR